MLGTECKGAPLYSLQYAPMKKAALLSGALVVPSSWTLGTSVGKGVGSTYGLDDKPGSWMGDAIVADSENECSQHRPSCHCHNLTGKEMLSHGSTGTTGID